MGNEYDLVEFNKVSADIAEIKSAGDFLPDCSTKEGYEASKRFCLDYTVKARGQLTDAHKKTKAPFLETCRLLDEKKAELMETLRSIETPHMLAYKGHDEEKAKAKVDFERSIMDKIHIIIGYRKDCRVKTSKELKELIRMCREVDTSQEFYHLKDKAVFEKQETLSMLNSELADSIEAELVARQIKADNKKQIENDYEVAILLNEKFDRDAVDALAREEEESERQRVAAEEQARKNEEEAIARGRQQEIERHENERARLEEEEKLRSEDKICRSVAKQNAATALMRHCKLTETQVYKVVESIELNLIPNVTIKY